MNVKGIVTAAHALDFFSHKDERASSPVYLKATDNFAGTVGVFEPSFNLAHWLKYGVETIA